MWPVMGLADDAAGRVYEVHAAAGRARWPMFCRRARTPCTDRVGMAADRGPQLERGQVPQLDSHVVAAGGGRAAVGRNGDGADRAGVPFQRAGRGPLGDVPDNQRLARRRPESSARAIGREGDRADGRDVPFERGQFL